MSQHRWDVLGLGCVAVDDLLYLDEYPKADTKVRIKRHERSVGGLAGNALVAASRLGASCAFAGTLGDDVDSNFVRVSMLKEKIDLSPIVHRVGVRPIHSTILIDESKSTRTILFDLVGTIGASPRTPSAKVIRSARVLLVDHYGIDGMTRAALIAREAGNAVVGDLERDEWPGFQDLLALVDHVIIAEPFARKLTGTSSPRLAVERLWNETRQLVAVTCGANGCWYRTAQTAKAIRQPAFAIEAVDTTGCGDVFHGAYAAAIARGMPLPVSIRLATAAASLKAARSGGQSSYPTMLEVERLLSDE
jgi:sugar/nucleoside kinase (ribokinase family)